MKKHITLLFAAIVIGFASGTFAQGQAPASPPGVSVAAHSAPVCPGPASRGSARCHARVVTDANGVPVVTPARRHGGSSNATPSGYGSTQFLKAYGLDSAASLNGAGITIGIVDAYDNPYIESDLGVYSSQFGLPECTTANGCFRKVNQNGGTSYPRGNTGWGLEIALDVQVAHATCPHCNILLVEASSNSFSNLLAAEDYATAHADVVSNSWGGSEFSSETSSSYDGHFDVPGVPITASSGDGGYGVEYPASSRYVTAVGGTTLKLNSDNTRSSETVWSGAGSGCSAYETQPAWQTGLVDPSVCSHRIVADVSADADPYTGAAVYDSYGYGGWLQVGGTSLASPLIASVYALAGNNDGASIVYSYAASNDDPPSPLLFDVKSGSNGSCGGSYLCTGGTGYDGPTGLGTPNGPSAFGSNATTTVTASLVASPSSISSGDPSTLSWSSSNATSCTSTAFSTGTGQQSTSGSVTVAPTETTTYHVICTDGSHSASASATVTVSSVTVQTMSVPSITYALNGFRHRNLGVTVLVQSGDGANLPGASVSITLTNTTVGQSWNGSGTTGSNGTVSLTLRNAPSGTYHTAVDSVTETGYSWNRITPSNGFTK